MVEFKFVINDNKTGKTYQKAIEDISFLGKKVGEKISGDMFGLEGYELQISGGTDFAGFPMRKEIEGPIRKKALLSYGVGMRKSRAGLRIRKTVCGNTISEKITQINLRVVKEGSKPMAELFAPPAEETTASETS